MSHPNLHTYENSEQLSTFTDLTFRDYCARKLDSCALDIERIRRCCVDAEWAGRVVEVGSGNSKLLYALERADLLTEGLGIEVSRSRHSFAQAFKEWAGSTKTTNILGNVLDMEPVPGRDLVCAMDLALQLVAAISDDAEDRVLSWIRASLRRGGSLLAEVRDFTQFINQGSDAVLGTGQFWDEFPPPDPWRFALNRIAPADGPIVSWSKTFIRRDSAELSHTAVQLRQHTPETFCGALRRHGFGDVRLERERAGLFVVSARSD